MPELGEAAMPEGEAAMPEGVESPTATGVLAVRVMLQHDKQTPQHGDVEESATSRLIAG